MACAAVYAIEPVAAFAGGYTATYTPQGASAATRTYDLTVGADGTVSGALQVGGVPEALGALSRAGNVRNGCDTSKMALSLVSTPSTNAGEAIVAGEALSAARARQGTLVGSYPATFSSEAVQSSGTLVVAVAASAG